MSRQAAPDQITQFQQDVLWLLNNSDWTITLIAGKMKVNSSNLSANINYKPENNLSKGGGKRPGLSQINKFNKFFLPVIAELKRQLGYFAQDKRGDFGDAGQSGQNQQAEDDKKFWKEQISTMNSGFTELSKSYAKLATSHDRLTTTHQEISMAYIRLTSGEKPPGE